MTPHDLQAAPGWRVIDFISDLHLQAAEPDNFAAWQRYMQRTDADAVFILGDLFEVWVGDDAATPTSFERQCADVIQDAAKRLAVFFMRGNRDFLMGGDFMALCQATLLPDPTVLVFARERFLLSHGDALCLADTPYQKFRVSVRSAQWQHDFLAQPLADRKAVARGLRAQSEAQKKSALGYADVDAVAATAWLHQAQARQLIHGHTHKPADHALSQGLRRIVLSDWDVAATPPRAQVLRLEMTPQPPGIRLTRIPPQAA